MTLTVWAQVTANAGLWLHLLPLVAVVSLVYSATRHEHWSAICPHALRLGWTILVFMLLMMVVIVGMQWNALMTLGVVGVVVAVVVARRRYSS